MKYASIVGEAWPRSEHNAHWLDNNATERALRALILGRKNHYGSKSERGMKAAAILYSPIETCQLVGVNPRGSRQSTGEGGINDFD